MTLFVLAAISCISPKDVSDPQETGVPAETAGEETGLDTPIPGAQKSDEAEDIDPREDVVRVQLTAAPHSYEAGGETIEGWAYNGQVPGPTIRVPRGARLEVELTNELDNGTTIHWHGVHVPWNMDGVVWMGEPIAPSTVFTYSFAVDQPAGTFWYHPHYDTQRQVDLGLYGTLIIEEEDEPRPDHDLVAMLDSRGEVEEVDTEGVHHGLEGIDIEWTVNSLRQPVFEAQVGESIRLRLLNASNTGYAKLSIPGARIVARDQGVLPQPESAETLLLAPGDRSDVEITVSESLDIFTSPYSHNGGEAFGPDELLLRIESQRR